MRIKTTAIQDNTVFEAQPGGQARAKGLAPDKPPFTGQSRLGKEFRPIRGTFSLARWIRAGLIGVAVAYPAYAEDASNPFNREPVDPIEQGKIDSANDPAESINRPIFSANKYFDDHLLKPAARAFGEDLAPEARQGIHNFVTNIGEPLVLANDVLQGNAERAWNTAQRFAVNSTIGVAGIVDVGASWGRPYHYADLGQTFGVWGIGPGPAVQIPLLGPSNLRDGMGLATTSVASFFAPPSVIVNAVSYTELGATAVSQVDYRAKTLPNTDALEKSTKDLYAATRLIKAQMRVKLVEEGKAGAVSRDGGSGAGASSP
ncbi:MAG: VacJ family lipoprotein [Rhodomicrobium sp.]